MQGIETARAKICRAAKMLRASSERTVDRDVIFVMKHDKLVKLEMPMDGGQDETIAVRPVCGGGVIFEHLCEQHGGDIGGAHRQTRTTRFRLFHSIHGERANGIRHVVMGDFVFGGRHQLFTIGERSGESGPAAPSTGAAGCGSGAKARLAGVWQPLKGLGQRIAYSFFRPRFNLLGRENDFAATFALLSRRAASILARIT